MDLCEKAVENAAEAARQQTVEGETEDPEEKAEQLSFSSTGYHVFMDGLNAVTTIDTLADIEQARKKVRICMRKALLSHRILNVCSMEV